MGTLVIYRDQIVHPTMASKDDNVSILFQNSYCCLYNNIDERGFDITNGQRYVVAVFGFLHHCNFVNYLSKLEETISLSVLGDLARQLNGHYFVLLLDKQTPTVHQINDRFNSQLFFYAKNTELTVFSTSYSHARRVIGAAIENVDSTKIYEFLIFRRLYGQDTYHDAIKTIPPATILQLKVKTGEFKTHTFWKPRYNERAPNGSNSDWAKRIATGITNSVSKYFIDDKKRGLMLSGGLDSRALLGVGCERYQSFTNVEQKNNEFAIAQRLAETVGSSHEYINRPIDYLGDWFDQAIEISNGLTVFHEAQFVGYKDQLVSHVSAVDLGLALDIFFCGHYLPKYQPKIFGRHAWFFRLKRLPLSNLSDYFIENVSYRLKTSDANSIFSKRYRKDYREQLNKKIGSIFELGADVGATGYDLWEFMHLHNFGRHYSMLMANSMRRYVDVGIPALDNDLFDVALSMPVEYKYNWRAYVAALNLISPELMEIENSNTNISASNSLYLQTGKKIFRGLVNTVWPDMMKRTPAYWDRSWPTVDQCIKRSRTMSEKVSDLYGDALIYDIDGIDPDKLRALIREYTEGVSDHSIFINMLLTIEHNVLRDVM